MPRARLCLFVLASMASNAIDIAKAHSHASNPTILQRQENSYHYCPSNATALCVDSNGNFVLCMYSTQVCCQYLSIPYTCPQDHPYCCANEDPQNNLACAIDASCKGPMVNATLEFTSPVNSGNMSIVTSIMIGALAPSPTESATSIPISIPTSIPTNPSQTGAQIFPGAEDEYPACAVSPTDCFSVGVESCADSPTKTCVCSSTLRDASSCFKDQCSLEDRRLLQSAWNSNCNITVTPLPSRDGIHLTGTAKVGIVIASISIATMVIIPSFLLLRRQQRVNQSQNNSIRSYVLMLLSSPWFNWLASHIGFACMALALVMISSLGEDNDNEKLYPDYDDDVCSLINLILLPWIISMTVLVLEFLFIILFLIWLFREKKGMSEQSLAGKRQPRLAINITAGISAVADLLIFAYCLFQLAYFMTRFCSAPNPNLPLENLKTQWFTLPLFIQRIFSAFVTFNGFALISSVFWIWSELRAKHRWASLKKQTASEGTAMVEYKVEISGLRAVRDIYGMQE